MLRCVLELTSSRSSVADVEERESGRVREIPASFRAIVKKLMSVAKEQACSVRSNNNNYKMPGMNGKDDTLRKRKRTGDVSAKPDGAKPRKAPKTKTEDTQSQILSLESQILESPDYYGNIASLQKHISQSDTQPETATLAAVALCRVFCRLIASEALVRRKDSSEKDAQTTQMLRQRLREYVQGMSAWIGSPDGAMESTALTLMMRVAKEEVSQEPKRAEQAWRTSQSVFTLVLKALLEDVDAEGAREEFVEKYVEEHDDVRFYTFLGIKQYFDDVSNREEDRLSNALDLLSKIEGVPEAQEQLEDWYGEPPKSKKHPLLSLTAHLKVAQEAWLNIFRSPLTNDHRKKILNMMTRQVLPWFVTKVETLTDFLTDSFNAGGSTALLALSGIFHLITKKNIDYPDFYTKLYSLLDEDVLHSKHRSRFFRLLDSCMASTHLPASLVASFIKRFARLSLQAPPGAIVWIVPWVYNMLKSHPTCSFMLHRTYHPAHAIYAQHPDYEASGMDDLFDPTETDPMLTRAIDSSLWELETLSTHYHPNVATLAKIIGEQFTKREYQLEDFLDHSYASLIDAELGKALKKVPVVEFEIPKRIVTTEEGGLNSLGSLLESAVKAS
jgi:U3 small nucleolar RNA-associated protein 19